MNREQMIDDAATAGARAMRGATAHVGLRDREFAAAALAVFEEAHAPTDDEREALALALDGIPAPDGFPSGVEFWREEIESILAAGFRHTVQGEPSDAAVQAAGAHLGMGDGMEHWIDEDSVRAALRAAAEAEGGNR